MSFALSLIAMKDTKVKAKAKFRNVGSIEDGSPEFPIKRLPPGTRTLMTKMQIGPL
jgi:hypothetical protein